MRKMQQQSGQPEARPWQIGVCVLLAFLILYNPFAGLFCSHSEISLHTPHRHRATVGSSEMQHFSPVQEDTESPDLSVPVVREELPTPRESAIARGFEYEEVVTQPDVVQPIWSRPPPTL